MSEWNPGWEAVGTWLDSLDMTGPTPGAFTLSRDGAFHPLRLEDLTIRADRDRLIDEARD